MKVGQVVYTSAETEELRGYQIVAKSDADHVPAGDLAAISLASGLDAPISAMYEMPNGLLFYRLPSGRFAVARMYNAGTDSAGRKNRVLTHTLVVREEDFRAAGSTPFPFLPHLKLDDSMRGTLPPLEVEVQAPGAPPSLPEGTTILLRRLLESLEAPRRIAVFGEPAAVQGALAALFPFLPVPDRERLSFATFALTTSRDLFRVTGIPADQVTPGRVDVNAVTAIDPKEVPTHAPGEYVRFVLDALKGDRKPLEEFLAHAAGVAATAPLSQRLAQWRLERLLARPSLSPTEYREAAGMARQVIAVDPARSLQVFRRLLDLAPGGIPVQDALTLAEIAMDLHRRQVLLPEDHRRLHAVLLRDRRLDALAAALRPVPELPPGPREEVARALFEGLLDGEPAAVVERHRGDGALSPVLLQALDLALPLNDVSTARKVVGTLALLPPLDAATAAIGCSKGAQLLGLDRSPATLDPLRAWMGAGLVEADPASWATVYFPYRQARRETEPGRHPPPIGKRLPAAGVVNHLRAVERKHGGSEARREAGAFLPPKSRAPLEGDPAAWLALGSAVLDLAHHADPGHLADAVLQLSEAYRLWGRKEAASEVLAGIATAAVATQRKRLGAEPPRAGGSLKPWTQGMTRLADALARLSKEWGVAPPEEGEDLLREFVAACEALGPKGLAAASPVAKRWVEYATAAEAKHLRGYRKISEKLEKAIAPRS